MNACSVDIKDMVIDFVGSSTLHLEYAKNVFIGKEPASPKNCITIFDTMGFPPSLGLTDRGYEYPSIQIRVRNIDYLNGWDITNRIKDALHGRNHERWNGTLYTAIICSGGPALLDWDENGNARFIINFNVQRRR